MNSIDTCRVLFLPNDQTAIFIDIPRPVDDLAAQIRAGKWMLPEPYQALLAGSGQDRNGVRLRVLRFGRLLIVIPAQTLVLPAEVLGEAAAVRLSVRQRQVLDLLCSGMNNKQIAEALGVTLRTVALHLAEIKTRLGASSRTQVISRAAALGFLRRRENSEKW